MGGRLRHELYIDCGNEQANMNLLNQFDAQRSELESAYGRSLTFEELSGKRACRIADYHSGVDVADSDRYDEYIDWFFDAGERLRSALQVVSVSSST
jgi:hypothetical protein